MKEKKIAILGLGYVGLPLALQLSLSYSVVGYDVDDIRIKELRKGIDKTLEVSEGLLKKQQKNIQDKMIGRKVHVLFERKGRFDNQLVGKSEYLHAVNVTDPTISVGELKQVNITKSNPNSLSGSVSN